MMLQQMQPRQLQQQLHQQLQQLVPALCQGSLRQGCSWRMMQQQVQGALLHGTPGPGRALATREGSSKKCVKRAKQQKQSAKQQLQSSGDSSTSSRLMVMRVQMEC
jgi:hypothetical protein